MPFFILYEPIVVRQLKYRTNGGEGVIFVVDKLVGRRHDVLVIMNGNSYFGLGVRLNLYILYFHITIHNGNTLVSRASMRANISALVILRPYVSICLPMSSAVWENESSCINKLALS